MTFGDPKDFAIEAYHEPSGLEWAGCGRLCIRIQGACLGDIYDNHCSIFAATDRLRELIGLRLRPQSRNTIETLWDESFAGLSDTEIFCIVDHALFTGKPSEDRPRYARFDFLTNTGEMFDATKTFILCSPDERVHILCQFRDDSLDSFTCRVETFRTDSEAYVLWFDEQVRTIAPPFFPINPFDLNEKVQDNWNC
jgi:hypothetical protein